MVPLAPDGSIRSWPERADLRDDAVRAALGAHRNLRGHNVKPLMRSLLEFDVEVRGSLITFRGQPHLLAVIRDVTEYKQAQERLAVSEKMFRTIFETEPACVALLDGSAADRRAHAGWHQGARRGAAVNG